MANMANEAVTNSGPLIHLWQIDSLRAFDLWKVFAPEEVYKEVIKRTNKKQLAFVKVEKISRKDSAYLLAKQFELDLGEAEAIVLAKEKSIGLFFTDDLDARIIGKRLNLEVHGSVGILLRAFRNRVFSKKEVLGKLDLLNNESTLFITKNLVELAKKQVGEVR